MKKVVLFLWQVAFALPVGNPSDPALYSRGLWDGMGCADSCWGYWKECFHFRLGYYGDFVFNRHVEEYIDGEAAGDVVDFRIITNGGTVTLDCGWLDIYGLIGATEFNFFGKHELFASSFGWFSTSFCWSVGARATLWQCGNFDLGIAGQYFRTRIPFETSVLTSTGGVFHFNEDTMRWYEWQGSLAVSYTFCDVSDNCFVPYAGIKAAGADLESFDLAGGFPDLKSKKLWGYAIGMTAILCNTMGIAVEGRWADEKALFVNGQISF